MSLRFVHRENKRILQEFDGRGKWQDVPLVDAASGLNIPDPPAPEQPKVQMWECEAVMCVNSGETEPWVSHWRRTSVAKGDQVKARAKLGFDSTGRVWMEDAHAQYLARCLRDYARNWDAISEPSRETLKLAAHRLAGPEK